MNPSTSPTEQDAARAYCQWRGLPDTPDVVERVLGNDEWRATRLPRILQFLEYREHALRVALLLREQQLDEICAAVQPVLRDVGHQLVGRRRHATFAEAGVRDRYHRACAALKRVDEKAVTPAVPS